MGLEFIELNGKTSKYKFKDGGRPFEEVSHAKDIGMLIPDGFVVLDVDDEEESQVLLSILTRKKITCKVMKTDRGLHFWFKSEKILKNSIHIDTPIGITVDVRSWGKSGYVKIKKNGKMRKWIQNPSVDEVANLPVWLTPNRKSKKLFKLSQGSRNSALFTYIPKLQAMGMNRDEVKETLTIINDYILETPLDQSELDVIMRDESFDNEIEAAVEAGYLKDGKFAHNLFGDYIIGKLLPITINSTMYIYKDGYYQVADRQAEREMVRTMATIKRNQRTETLEYMKLVTLVEREDLDQSAYVINLLNTRLDIRTDEQLPFSPYVYDFNKLPVAYDPEAYSEALDRTLDKVFCNDADTRALFEEFVGYTLLGNNKFSKMVLFLGDGANGKSTILELLKAFIGSSNYSTLALDELGEKFRTAELENKMINIGDDIDAGSIKMTGVIKKLVTGEEITVERKNEHPFILRNKAKLIFSANKLPYIADKSYGMNRRLLIIPMNARFTEYDDDFDPFIEDKIKTPESLSYLLNLALKGIKRVFKKNGFTVPQVVKDELYKYKVANSHVLTWLRDQKITLQFLLDHPVKHLYNEMAIYLSRLNVKPERQPNVKTFRKELMSEFHLELKDVGKDTAEYMFEKTERTPDKAILVEL